MLPSTLTIPKFLFPILSATFLTSSNAWSLPSPPWRGGGTVQESPCVKNRGVIFDRNLTWDAHVSEVVRKRKCVGLLIGLRHLRCLLPQRALLAVVQGLVVSRVRYCLSVYGNGSAANDEKLLKVVNFATSVAAGLRRYDHVSRARGDLGLRTLRQMCEAQTAITALRLRALVEPEELASLFVTFADARQCNRPTRQDRDLRPPATRTAVGQRGFAYRAASLLNSMPSDATRLESAAFKQAGKRFFYLE